MTDGLGARLAGALRRAVATPPLVAAAPAIPIRAIFRRFWPDARPYRRWLGLTLVFIILAPAIDTATIWLFKLLVDTVLVPRNLALFPRLVAAYLGLTLLGGLVSFADTYLSTWVGERFLLALRTRFFRHLHDLSPDFFERRQLGDVLSRLTGDIAAIETFVLSGVASALEYALRIAFFLAALLYLQWGLTLVALVVTPLFWLASRRFSRLLKQASRERRRRSGAISAVAEESLANVALVQAYNLQEAEAARFHQEGRGSVAAQMATTRLRAAFAPLIDLIELAGVLVVVGVGTWERAHGALSLGGLLVFMAYLSQLYSPIRGLGRLTTTLYTAAASAERIIEYLDQRPAVTERAGAAALDRARGEIACEGVSFRYPGAGRDALTALTLRVAPGETLAIVGPSGAGKSTLVKLLLRFYDPIDGAISLDGRDLRDLRLRDLRANMAVVLQETLVFDGTIRANIAAGRPGATAAEIVRAARAADAHAFIASFPDGYDTMVGQKGRRLSGGQRQRIAIARAMIRDAPILILDEPTTGLDAESGWRILAPLKRLMDGRTTIIISHNLLTVREATTIAVLDGGRIVERGSHAELLRREGRYAQLYRLHAQPWAEDPVAVAIADGDGMGAGIPTTRSGEDREDPVVAPGPRPEGGQAPTAERAPTPVRARRPMPLLAPRRAIPLGLALLLALVALWIAPPITTLAPPARPTTATGPSPGTPTMQPRAPALFGVPVPTAVAGTPTAHPGMPALFGVPVPTPVGGAPRGAGVRGRGAGG